MIVKMQFFANKIRYLRLLRLLSLKINSQWAVASVKFIKMRIEIVSFVIYSNTDED